MSIKINPEQHRKVISDVTGIAKNKDGTDGNWYNQFNCVSNVSEPGHKMKTPENVSTKQNDKPDISEWSNKSDNIESKAGKKEKDMPSFNLKEIADLTDYAHVISKMEIPKWRKELLIENGPTGTKRKGFTDISELFMMEWDQKELGRLYFDSTRTIYFDGTKFMMRTSGSPDSDRIRSTPISLESWLIEVMRDRDVKLLKDKKWRYRNMWHELIRELQVSG